MFEKDVICWKSDDKIDVFYFWKWNINCFCVINSLGGWMNEKEDCSWFGCFCSCWVIDGYSICGSKNDKSKKWWFFVEVFLLIWYDNISFEIWK